MSKKLLIYLVLITFFSLAIRLYRLSEPNHYYFDEVYHVVTARAYAANSPAAYDPFAPPPETGTAYEWLHPPLAKLIQASSIKILGDKPFFWRLPSAIFGTALVLAVFALAFILFGPITAIFSSIIIAFENLNLVMSRITMNDIFLTFFLVVSFTFIVLFRRRKKLRYLFLASIFLGLAISSKWTGVYGMSVILGYVIFFDFKNKQLYKSCLLLLVIPLIIYILSYGQFWLQGHSVNDFINLNKQIWWYQNRHDLKHPYGTTPIYCTPEGINGPKSFCPWMLDARPVYFSFENYSSGAGYIYALGNPLVFWFGAAAVIYLIYRFPKEKDNRIILIIAGYLIFWVPWIFTPRILFMYHYLPSIPFLAIALGFVLSKIWRGRYKFVVFFVLIFIVLAFFYFYPITSGYPIKISSLTNYTLFNSWR